MSTFLAPSYHSQMPRLDGHAATRVLRREMGFRGLVIGVTGNAAEADVAAFIGAGASLVMPKPVDAQAVADYVRREVAS